MHNVAISNGAVSRMSSSSRVLMIVPLVCLSVLFCLSVCMYVCLCNVIAGLLPLCCLLLHWRKQGCTGTVVCGDACTLHALRVDLHLVPRLVALCFCFVNVYVCCVQDIIKRCLDLDYKNRITLEGILEHPWVVQAQSNEPLEGVAHLKDFINRHEFEHALTTAAARRALNHNRDMTLLATTHGFETTDLSRVQAAFQAQVPEGGRVDVEQFEAVMRSLGFGDMPWRRMHELFDADGTGLVRSGVGVVWCRGCVVGLGWSTVSWVRVVVVSRVCRRVCVVLCVVVCGVVCGGAHAWAHIARLLDVGVACWCCCLCWCMG